MAEREPRSHARAVGIRVAVLAALSGLLIAVGLGLRAATVNDKVERNTKNVDRTCGVLAYTLERQLNSLGKPGTPGYSYYQDHPDEARAARRDTQALLDHLACKPIPPP